MMDTPNDTNSHMVVIPLHEQEEVSLVDEEAPQLSKWDAFVACLFPCVPQRTTQNIRMEQRRG